MADLNALAIFAKVVEARSFSEAARRLKMPISTVSRRVAELEDQLGVRLLERSTRNLRLSDIGAEILAHAQRAAELNEALDIAVSNQQSAVAGLLRLSVPPSISDTLLAPLLSAFQASYPGVRVEVLVTERHVDHIAEGIDLAFRIGALKDSSLVARRILAYRRQLVAAPAYLQKAEHPRSPKDLLKHRLVAFARRSADTTWTFVRRDGSQTETIAFAPHLSMNDYAGLTPALVAGAGIGELPPVVQPELLRDGRLVEVMPDWRFPTWDLSVVHLGNRHVSRPVRVFKEFAAQMAPLLFPDLPK
jgi:DNA-binding transcriptional LysR family regulator